jgi:Fic family protein
MGVVVSAYARFRPAYVRGTDSQLLHLPTAGRYRNQNVVISGAGFIPPDHLHLPEKMAELIQWYRTEARLLHPIDRAAQLHTRFVEIHPFEDGNGRTARLLLNFAMPSSTFAANPTKLVLHIFNVFHAFLMRF